MDAAHLESPARADRVRDAAIFFLIVAVAFVPRFVFLREARAVPLFHTPIMDGLSYSSWSDDIANGDWLGDQIFYQAPLYPYFLAVVKVALGRDLATIRFVQILLGSLACGVLFLAGRELFSRRVGAVAGLLLALYPSAIFFDALIQKANLGLVWTVLLLWFVARALRAPSAWRWSLAGVTLGLLMLTREETILLVPLFAAWIVFFQRDEERRIRWRFALGWVCGLALALLPVGFRNLAVGGEFVLTTSQAGSNFYIGNGPRASGTYVPLRPGRSDTFYERRDAVELAEAEAGRTLTPSEVSRFWFSKSFAHIRAEPGAWVALLWRKIALLFNAYELPDAEDLYYYERSSRVLRFLGKVWNYGVLVPLACAGLVLTWNRRRELAFLYAMLGVLCVGPVLFYVFARYRYPLVPLFAVFAAAAIVECWSSFRARRYGRLAIAGATILVIAPLVNWPLYSKSFQLPEAYNNAGVALARSGNDAAAVEEFQRSIALKPGTSETHGNLGVSLLRLGRAPEAIAAFRRALELKPNDSRAELRLGSALTTAGNAREGIPHLERATALAPTNAEAWNHLAIAYSVERRFADAIRTLQTAVNQVPDEASLAANLAWLLATGPDPALRDGRRAVAIAEPLCRRTNGNDVAALDALAAAYAESGRFDEAVETGRQAAALARAQGHTERVAGILARVALYLERKPFHQTQ